MDCCAHKYGISQICFTYFDNSRPTINLRVYLHRLLRENKCRFNYFVIERYTVDKPENMAALGQGGAILHPYRISQRNKKINPQAASRVLGKKPFKKAF